MASSRNPYKGEHVNSAYHAPIRQSWRAGYNTLQIAKAFKVKECDVARIIAAEQDRRYAEWHDADPKRLVASA
jgi:hypothetical protein